MNKNTARIDLKAPKFRVWGADEVLYGPFELPRLIDWVRKGRVTVDTWIFSDLRHAWHRASELDELQPLFLEPSRFGVDQAISAIRGGVSGELLPRFKIMAGLTEPQCQSFLEYMEILTIEPMAYAVREGDDGEAMFLILEGELRVSLRRQGKENVLATLKAGDFFGEVSLLDRGHRSADVIANDRSTLLKISATAFGKLRREAPALTEPFLFALGQTVVGRVRQLNKRYEDSVQMLQALSVT